MVDAMSDRDILNELNRDYVRSVQTSNVQRFEEILADDFLCSLPDGSLVDRKTFLEQTARPITISNLEAQDVDIRLVLASGFRNSVRSDWHPETGELWFTSNGRDSLGDDRMGVLYRISYTEPSAPQDSSLNSDL